jgi:DNA polymerase elongation subunit (family B)
MKKRIFFDIETSPNVVLSWRTGYNLNIGPENILKERAIICICWKFEDEDEIHSLTWDKKHSDKAMLKAFIKELNKATEICGHNSDRFDLKWLRTRCLFHSIDIFPKYQTLDTLKMAKSGFYFNSNKLDYIAQFLGVGKKTETGGFDLWKKVVLDSDAEALQLMVDYCKNDVLILEEVYKKMQPYVEHKMNYATLNGEQKYCCPECGSANVRKDKTYTTKMGVLKHSMTCFAGRHPKFTISNKTYMKFLEDQVRMNKKVVF